MAAPSEPQADAVKGTMLQAHVAWARAHLPSGALETKVAALDEQCARYLQYPPLATDWIPLRCLVAIDEAIAAAAGGQPLEIYRALGHHSAVTNLQGVYKAFAREEPHHFFEQQALLHRRFQNFGTARYARGGLQSGRLHIEGYERPSAVFCASGRGYFEGALEMMKVPGPIQCLEVLCQCTGDPQCLYDLSW
jgi:hypothetical protein